MKRVVSHHPAAKAVYAYVFPFASLAWAEYVSETINIAGNVCSPMILSPIHSP